MKAIVYAKYGPPNVLQIKEVEKPVPEENEILIKLHATAVTVGDVRLRKADPFIARTFNGLLHPKKNILGMNFAGEVEEIGNNAKQFKRGDKVFGSTAFEFGCYAEYITISEESAVTTIPSNISYEEAAVIPFGTLTSLHFLKKGNITKGQKVLIYGASGSLGVAAVQLAKYFGAEVTAVCGPSNLELVRSLGADIVIDYTKENFAYKNQIYDIVYDAVGKSDFSSCLKTLDKNGYYLRSVHMGVSPILRGLWTKYTTNKKIVGGISIERKKDLDFIKKLIEEGKFKSVIDKTYKLEQIAEAHAYVERGHKKGNVAITIEH